MKDLIEKLAQADGPSRELDAEISRALAGGPADHWYQDHRGVYVTDNSAPCYTASIDAAMTLFSARPLRVEFGTYEAPDRAWAYVHTADDQALDAENCATPAIALCIAALSAKEPNP